MKKLFLIGALLVSAASGASAQNLSLQLGQTGYYGSIDLGNLRAPPVIYQQPMYIDRSVRYTGAPVYMRVPPGHAKKWAKHCAAYNACGRPVYFVQDSWYNNTYAPQYRRSHGGGGRHDAPVMMGGRGDDRGDYRGDYDHGGKRDKHDKHDKHDDDHGNGHGNGKGKGHGKH
jgi:hypothetical protein